MPTVQAKKHSVKLCRGKCKTGHRRGDNHIKDLLNKREGKPLWEHSREFHEGKLKEEDYKMIVTRRFKTPL